MLELVEKNREFGEYGNSVGLIRVKVKLVRPTSCSIVNVCIGLPGPVLPETE